jgi:hypothetical protein
MWWTQRVLRELGKPIDGSGAQRRCVRGDSSRTRFFGASRTAIESSNEFLELTREVECAYRHECPPGSWRLSMSRSIFGMEAATPRAGRESTSAVMQPSQESFGEGKAGVSRGLRKAGALIITDRGRAIEFGPNPLRGDADPFA